jgi:hypothetical protein
LWCRTTRGEQWDMSKTPPRLDAALALLNDGADVTKTLDLARAQVSEAEALTLATAMEMKSGTLTCIDLRDCNLSGRGVAALSKAAGKCVYLRTLRLCGNGLTLDGASSVAELVAAHQTLAKLELRYCRMENHACEVVCGAVGKSLSLEELNLSGNAISDSVAQALAGSIYSTISLLKLSLADANLKNLICRSPASIPVGHPPVDKPLLNGVETLFENLKRSPLRELHLPFNFISTEMAASLAAVLLVSSKLTTLNLHSCDLSDEAVLELASGIRSGPQRRDAMKLVGLDLSTVADRLQLPEKVESHQQILDFFMHEILDRELGLTSRPDSQQASRPGSRHTHALTHIHARTPARAYKHSLSHIYMHI